MCGHSKTITNKQTIHCPLYKIRDRGESRHFLRIYQEVSGTIIAGRLYAETHCCVLSIGRGRYLLCVSKKLTAFIFTKNANKPALLEEKKTIQESRANSRVESTHEGRKIPLLNAGDAAFQIMKSKVVVLDNGAGSIKVGLSGASDPSFVLPNCSASLDRQYRTLYADETEILVKNKSQLKYTRPFERGYLTDWPTQSDIWNYVFSPKVMNIVPKESQGLVVTEPPFNPVTMQNKMDELVFEQHEFPAYFCATSAEFSSQYYKYQYSSASTCDKVCSLVVDSGYSFTHAVPVFDCHPLTHSIRRVDVGGKFLTNYLKELVSYRAYNMQDETHIMNDVKEKLCFCSQMPNIDFSRNPTTRKLRREYVLPNYRSTMQGYVRPRDTNSESLPHEMEDGNTNDLVNEETNEKQLSSRLKTSDNKTLQGTPQKKNARSNDS
eukprot:GSMAST32.ASY1.ANO1.2298.1 assembled CDS